MFPFVAVFVIIIAILFGNWSHFNCSCHREYYNIFSNLAEGTRFELAVLSYAGFQDQCHQPLGHPSTLNYIISFN